MALAATISSTGIPKPLTSFTQAAIKAKPNAEINIYQTLIGIEFLIVVNIYGFTRIKKKEGYTKANNLMNKRYSISFSVGVN